MRAVGTNAGGKRFKFDTVLVNFSHGGLYLYLPGYLCPDLTRPDSRATKMYFVVWFSHPTLKGVPAAPAAMLGKVLRTELQPSGVFGVAVAFTKHRLLRKL